TRMLADWYDTNEAFINRADTLAKLQTLWGDANVVNQIPGWIEGVTSADIQRVAATYLTKANRTVIDRKLAPKEAPATAPAAAPGSAARGLRAGGARRRLRSRRQAAPGLRQHAGQSAQ